MKKIYLLLLILVFSCSNEKTIRIVGVDGKAGNIRTYMPLENSILMEKQKQYVIDIKSKKEEENPQEKPLVEEEAPIIKTDNNQVSKAVENLQKELQENHDNIIEKELIRVNSQKNQNIVEDKLITKEKKPPKVKKIKKILKKTLKKAKVKKDLYIQIGIFSSKYRAQGAVDEVSKFGKSTIKEIKRKNKKSIYKVSLGPIKNNENQKILKSVRKKGFSDAFIK